MNRGDVINLMWIVAIIGIAVFAVLKWQESTDQQQAILDAQEEKYYYSPSGEFLMEVPTGWTVFERDTGQEGGAFIELQGPRNDIVDKIFASNNPGYEGSIADAVLARDFKDLVDTPSGQDYALLVMEIVSGLDYRLPESKEPAKEEIESTSSVASGVAYGTINDFAATGADGYKYDATVSTSNGSIDITNYYLLGDLAEVDAFFYPANSSFAKEAEEIMQGITIFTFEALEEAAAEVDQIQQEKLEETFDENDQ